MELNLFKFLEENIVHGAFLRANSRDFEAIYIHAICAQRVDILEDDEIAGRAGNFSNRGRLRACLFTRCCSSSDNPAVLPRFEIKS